MTIDISEFASPNLYRSKHWMHTKTGDNKELISLSGVVIVNLKGKGQKWKRNTLNLYFALPPNIIPEGKLLRIEQWVPMITINAIYNKNHAVNAGWAVDEFGGPGPVDTARPLSMWAHVAIRDIDGYLYRVAYSLSLVGTFIEDNRPPIK